MDLLKFYKNGEHLMHTFPFLGNIHHKLSQSIIDWCKRHHFVRFDNLRAPNSTEDDVKKCSAFWFILATLSGLGIVYQIFSLEIGGILFFSLLFFIPYAIGVVNLEALKIEPKITNPAFQNVSKIEKEPIEKEIPPQSFFSHLLNLGSTAVFVILFFIVLYQPELIQEWVQKYHLYDYVKDWNIEEKNIGGIFALAVLFSYAIIVRILRFLFRSIHSLNQYSDKNYSAEKMKRYRNSNISKKDN